MTPNVATGAMARPAADTRRALAPTALLALMVTAAPAVAGDRALIDFIGYSDDGRYFAFEEYGMQDGSGFPYANIYVVDLPADAWVTGSPFRVQIDNEEADVEEAREQAFAAAEATLEELEIGEAAHVIALNGDGEPSADVGDELVFGQPGFGLDPVREPQTLSLETFPLAPGTDCAILDNEVFGFALSLEGVEVHRDSGTLPASRGCAMGYKIYAVVSPAEWTGADDGSLVVISSYPFGFEGPGRRFLVVPLE